VGEEELTSNPDSASLFSALFLVPSLILVLIFCRANLQIVLMNPGLPIWGSII
jgi:hypothetical protein